MAPGTLAVPWKPSRQAICCLLIASLVFPTVGVARADIITTEQAVNSTPQIYSDSVLTFLRRSNVEYQLRSLGVDQKSVEERVAARMDEEVQAPVEKLESLYVVSQYVAPPLVGTGGVSGVSGVGGVGGVGGAYGGGYSAVNILVSGLVAVVLWKLAQTSTSNPDYMTSNPAPMDPNRKISEQDCTKPIVFDGGNLRCK